MDIEFELLGFDDIMKQLETLATGSELDEVAEKIITDEVSKAKSEIASKFPRSKDNSKSGKRGNRPSSHFVDNIPQSKIKKKDGYLYIEVGESKDDGEFWYTKFPEWGTSRQKPNLVFAKVRETIQKDLNEKGIEEYGKLLQEKLGG